MVSTSVPPYEMIHGEGAFPYIARLKRAYAEAEPNSRERQRIAYGLACSLLGRENVRYGAVVVFLKRAGTFDAFCRAVFRTSNQRVMQDPIQYAMAIVRNDRHGNYAPRTIAEHLEAGLDPWADFET